MKVSNIKRISAQDVPGAPEWFITFLDPLNEALEQLTQAVSGNLTITDNMNAYFVSQQITHGTALAFMSPVKLSARPAGIIPVSATLVSDGSVQIVSGFGWVFLQDGRISATANFAAGGTTQCNVKMLILGG